MAPGGTENLQTRVSKYFRKVSDNPGEIYYQCLISDKCVKWLNGKKPYNLVCHAKTHKEFYRQHFENNAEELSNMPATRLHYIQCCAEIVTINGQPFTSLNKSGFIKLNADKLQLLANTGYGEGLGKDCPAVKNHIGYLTSEIIKQIKSEVNGKFVALMVDTATKYRRSILGISIQFLQNSSITIRSIGMVHLTSSHSANYITTKIFDQLKLFEIDVSQIISVTTDNARNMVSMINRCNAMHNEKYGDESDISSEGSVVREDSVDRNCDGASETLVDIDELQARFQEQFLSVSDADATTQLQNYLDELEMESPDFTENGNTSSTEANVDFETLLRDLADIIATHTLNINGIRCAAHTLQLAIIDALKNGDFKNLILLCKVVVKELRKQSTVHELEKQQIEFKIPSIDCATRWNSSFKMVNSFSLELVN